MSKETRFVEADRYIARTENNELHIRLISESVVMYQNIDLEEMKKLRDWLSGQIELIEKRG